MSEITLAEDHPYAVKHVYKDLNVIIRFRYSQGSTVPFGAIIIAEDNAGDGHLITLKQKTYDLAVAEAKEIAEFWIDAGRPKV